MVVAQEARAARIGVDILKRGGNAVDAAVAVGFAMAVTYPGAGNLGGGGFMVIHLAKDNSNTAIDYRETAPAAASKTMFLDAQGNPDPAKSRDTGLAVGVPGTVAGLALAEKKYGSGKFTLAELIAPAIELAQEGIPGRGPCRRLAAAHEETIGALAVVGRDLFQERRAAAGRRPAGAVRSCRDLAGDRPTRPRRLLPRPHRRADRRRRARRRRHHDRGRSRELSRGGAHAVVRGSYRGYDIISMPPPSSGGVTLVEMLNILEGYDLAKLGRTAPALHDLIEAMKRAYADRAVYLGDPAFVKMPLAGLTSKKYAARLRARIGERATPAADIRPGQPADNEGHNTTHFSVIDRDGNAVSNTYTLNFSYGLGLVADGTGVLLNNELDDFTAKPGTANAYGLVGFDANLPAPNKRPLSSMTPTIVLKDGKPFLVTGSPGGSRIITAVLQVITNVIDFHMPVADAVSAPRLHHQWQPDKTFAEPGFDPAVLDALKARGHTIVPTEPHTAANSIDR